MIKEVQQAFINHFEAVREASSDKKYPKIIKPYAGELGNLGKVNAIPALYVNIAVNGALESDDTTGSLHLATMVPEIIIFAQNKARKSARYTELAELFEWVYEALKGVILEVNGSPVAAAKQITWRAFTETNPGYIVIMPQVEVLTS